MVFLPTPENEDAGAPTQDAGLISPMRGAQLARLTQEGARPMLYQLLAGGIVRFIDFGIGVETEKAGSFAFEKCAAFSGLLLIGWPVAIIFEVMKMADVRIGRCFG